MSHPEQDFLGIEIGGSKLQIVYGKGVGDIQKRRRFEVDQELGGDGIRNQIKGAVFEMIRECSPVGIGVGFGGPVDWRNGRISRSHQIEGWSGFELADWLSELTQLPVCMENDANLAALAEAHRGSGQGKSPVFYVTLGSGVGGGLIVNGEIYHGVAPGESEIGHIRLDQQGTVVEDRCSGWAVDRKIRDVCREQPESLLARLARESPGSEARHLSRALQEGDPVAQEVLAETVNDLALGLSHVVHLFHPEVIVIGGGLSLLGEPLREALMRVLPRLVMGVFRDRIDVRLASLGEDSAPAGALILAGR